MVRKSTATLLLFSIMFCLLVSSYLGGATTNNGQPISDCSRQYGNAVAGGDSLLRRSPGSSDDNVSLVNLWVNREVNVGYYGLVTVNDTAMIHNNDSVTASSWTFYLPSDVYPKLKYLAVYTNATKKLDVAGAPPYLSYIGIRVEFDKVGGLAANSSLSVSIIQQYVGIAKTATGTEYLGLYFYRYLISPYLTMNHTTSIRMPWGGEAGQTFQVKQAISPFNCIRLGEASDGSWIYTPIMPAVEILSIDRRVELESTGYLLSTEKHVVKNLGPTQLSSLRLVLPLSVISGTLEARDSSGTLQSTVSDTNVTVLFRTGFPIQVNQTYTYYVSYKTLVDNYKTVEDGLDVIRMQSATVYDCGIDSETVVVVLPYHTSLSSTDQYAEHVQIEDGKPAVTYTLKDFTPLNNQPIELRYSLDVAVSLERPLFMSLGIFLIGMVYLSARKMFPEAKTVGVVREEEKSRELKGLIKEFASNYEEKTALTIESEKLGEDRRKGKISKREYVERLNVSKRRIGSLGNLVNEEKRKLSLANKRYAGMIKQLDTYEEERENAKASLENLELRRRQGKAVGDVYNRLKYENTKKIEKATASIDSIITQFRQELL